MKKYKVLTKDLKSPFKNFQYEIGEEYVCEEFDEGDEKCSDGFYATDVEGILYSFNKQKNNKVFEVEVSGKSKIFDQFKQRFERQTIIREVPMEELKQLVKAEDEKLDYKFEEAMFPFNPLFGEPKEVTEEIKELLNKWASVRDSVWNSVWGSVRGSVRDSVWASVNAYIGSIFPKIKKWKYAKHEEGVYPFQPAVDLWYKGFVPSFDGEIWRLHSGERGQVVFEKMV